MPTPAEHKTVQARILAYAQDMGWTYVPRAEAQKRRGFDTTKATPAEQAAEASPYFDDVLDANVRAFNPKYAEGPGALVGDLRHLHATIAGNRDFLAYLRNAKTFYDKEEGRELNLVVIHYDEPGRNVFEVTGGVLLPQRQLRHPRGRGIPHQRHPGAGDRVQERHQGRGHRAGRRSGPPQGMPADLNTRSNIFVLIDEAHRTTGGDLGVYLMAGVPNAVFIGFTGTPVDKTAFGKGTFKTFGTADQQGYLHKYSISESIEDGTTLPLYYTSLQTNCWPAGS